MCSSLEKWSYKGRDLPQILKGGYMSYTNYLNLQMYAEDGAVDSGFGDGATAADVAENPAADGVATGDTGEQTAPAAVDQTGEESWDSLIKGKYKKEYDAAVKGAIQKRFKNQQNQQAQINAINPLVQALAKRYNIQANPDGSIPIDQLSNAVMFDDQALQQEAYDRGMSVETLRQIKTLERENSQLKDQGEQARQQQEWAQLRQEADELKEFYPDFDLETEMSDPQFISLLATLRNSGFEGSVKKAYEVMHHDELMMGSMQYATQRTKQMVANSIKSGMNRPKESASGSSVAGGMQGVDPSKLTDEQIDDYIRRANAGERITFM